MTKRVVAGVFLAVVASAITASLVVVVVGQERREPGQNNIEPIKAREEWVPKTLPGTPVAGLALPIDYGRFHIVAPETDPGPYAPGPTPPPGTGRPRVDVKLSEPLDELRRHDLFVEPPYIPAGWELTDTQAETVVYDDGSSRDTLFGLEYTRPEYFYIRILRLFVAPEGKVRLVANPQGDVNYTLGEIRGVPVVYDQDPMRVHFVQGDVLTQIEAPLLDLDELIKIADGLIAQGQKDSS